MTRKSRIGESRIRQLKPGEQAPDGEPRRYTSDRRGYVRLRWKVGPGQYVETYEHRLVAGIPDADVHHDNETKDDNRPENLHVLSKSEHASEHGSRASEASLRRTQWGGLRSQLAYDKQQARLAREASRRSYLQEVATLYRSGMTTMEIAAVVGRDNSNVSRALRAAGVAPKRGKKAHQVTAHTRQVVQARAGLRCERCGRNVAWGGGQIHHRRPRGAGGSRAAATNGAANLLLLCLDCHQWVESNRSLALADGLLVPTGTALPSSVPVKLLRGVVRLDDSGGEVPA